MNLNPRYLLVLMVLFYQTANAQISIGVSIGGIGYHPKKDSNSQFYKWKLDKKGKFVGYSSLSLIVSYRYNQNFGLKLNHTHIFHDCAGKRAGVTHLGINLYDDIIGRKNQIHEFSLSFGPLWYYRKNWSKEPRYKNNPKFMKMSKSRIWEKKFVWHGGTIEYNYTFQDNYSFSANILPGYPFLYTAVFGLNKRLEKN